MRYRLKVRCGKRWILGIVEYITFKDAQDRKKKMESVGHTVKIVDNKGSEC